MMSTKDPKHKTDVPDEDVFEGLPPGPPHDEPRVERDDPAFVVEPPRAPVVLVDAEPEPPHVEPRIEAEAVVEEVTAPVAVSQFAESNQLNTFSEYETPYAEQGHNTAESIDDIPTYPPPEPPKSGKKKS